jgi:hypothetical protein
MTKVRIVGGGLAGVLAALEAHRLGARDIELHERLGELGGVLAARVAHGLELRDRWRVFGGREDPARRLLEWHGAAFDDLDLTCGSINPCPRGEPVAVQGFAGPVLSARDPSFGRLTGDSLADRLRVYPDDVRGALARYSRWRLGVWLDEAHASAALPLGIDQVRFAGARTDDQPAKAALPRDGFAALFTQAQRALENLGVKLCFESLVSPLEVLEGGDEVTVWAAPPASLFEALGKTPPQQIGALTASYVFETRGGPPAPFLLQNFTARGSVFRLSVYPSRGENLLLAECVDEASDADLRREIHELLAGFGGDGLKLGDTLAIFVETRWNIPSVEEMKKLGGLRSALAAARGPTFVPGAWEAVDPAERFRRLSRALTLALADDLLADQAAA